MVETLEQQVESYKRKVCRTCDGNGMIGNMFDFINCPDCKDKEINYLIEIIHGAGDHLSKVMREHPYCDHVQVVKNFADIKIKLMGIS